MTVIWFADGARVTAPTNDGQALDRIMWLDGIEPGQLAVGELNPVVGWSRAAARERESR